MSTKPKRAARIPSGWETDSGLTPELHLLCDKETTAFICENVEQGLPLELSLDLAGVPLDTYREWSAKAGQGETPHIWATTMIRKARANYLYSTLLDLNMADEKAWRKYMTILQLRNPEAWGTTAESIGSSEAIDPEFM